MRQFLMFCTPAALLARQEAAQFFWLRATGRVCRAPGGLGAQYFAARAIGSSLSMLVAV
jgi:hypothetical protein